MLFFTVYTDISLCQHFDIIMAILSFYDFFMNVMMYFDLFNLLG